MSGYSAAGFSARLSALLRRGGVPLVGDGARVLGGYLRLTVRDELGARTAEKLLTAAGFTVQALTGADLLRAETPFMVRDELTPAPAAPGALVRLYTLTA
ncbi:hypothetical protein DM785_02515 [Deinococcus actinosclerus]|nr:hypothetical protein DM785_02515 [Deinococcus actinosclerus]